MAAAPFTDRLLPYVATDRLHAIAVGEALPERQQGAVLLADISGFTPLTERLVAGFGARRGGEELTRHLNLVYGALNDEIERYRGSVIGFSGDAVTCWFAEDDGLTAARCAWRLQHLMKRFSAIETPTGEVLSLAIKVAVAAGSVRRFAVGDAAVQLVDVLCGSVLDRVAAAEQAGQRGEVVVCAEVAAACGDRLQLARWVADGAVAVVSDVALEAEVAGWPELAVGALEDAQLRPWLLPEVFERLRSGQGDYLAELRQAAALFLQFTGLDFERDDDVGRKLDGYVRWVQGVVRRYEGALIQITTGDKGSYLYAAFGAPIAHEDVAERAACAALALASPPPEVGYITCTRIGISRGQMRTGGYGSERRRTYGVLGDETNVAARLMTKAAPGQILASKHIVKTCKGVRFESLGTAELKGKRTAVPVFAVAGLLDEDDARGRPNAPILGRAEECATLQRCLAQLVEGEDGAGRALVLEGDPGIGKTRLLDELLDRAAAGRGRVTCVVTRATAIEHAVAYFALRSVFAQRLEVPTGDAAEVLAHLQRDLPSMLAGLAPLLGVVLERDLPDTPATAALEGALRASQTRRFLAALFHWLYRDAPVLLVIEDAHYLDSASWATLEAIQQQPGRVLIALAVRSHHAAPEPLLRLRAAPTTTCLAVPPLPPGEIRELVRQRLDVSELPSEVSNIVCKIAEGNPLFAEEVGYSLRDAGVIEIRERTCFVVAKLDSLPFPETLEGVVTSRIDRLSPAEQLTLKVASVIGRAFQAAPVQDAFPVGADRERVPTFLDALASMEFTTPDEHLTEAAFSFKHAITQDVAYNLMLFEQRRALHDKVADWYERSSTGSSSYAIIAHHRLCAISGVEHPEPEALLRAIEALARAGRRSIEVGATLEAINFLTQARGLLGRAPTTRATQAIELDLCSWLGTALAVVRGPMHADVRHEFGRARELADSLNDKPRLFETLFNLWWWNLTGSERAGALEMSAQLLELAGADATLQVLAAQARGAVLISIGEHAEGLAYMQRALGGTRLARTSSVALLRVRDPHLMGHCYGAWASLFLGWPDRSLEHGAAAISVAKEIGHPLNAAQASCFAALIHRFRRDVDATAAEVRRAAALEPEHGSPYWIGVRIAIEAWVAIEQGRTEEGVAALEHLAAKDREAGVYPLVWIIARADLIDGLTRLGRYDDAVRVVEEARGVFGTRLLGFGEPEVHRREGELWARRGDARRALACLERGLEVARAQGARTFELRLLTSLVRLGAREPSLPTGAHLEALRDTSRWFTEGASLPDLCEARELLASVQEGQPCNLEAVERYVLERLGRELSPRLTYHDIAHTRDDVVPAVKRLAALARRSRHETMLLVTAAWLHDLGFVECRLGHEQVGIGIARELLPSMGYPLEAIDTIASLIAATKLPQTPRCELGQLLADADLDVLGRSDFPTKNEGLRRELDSFGESSEITTWVAAQIRFVREHRYFTQVARELRAEGKRTNLARLERRLHELPASSAIRSSAVGEPRAAREHDSTSQSS
ncbi:MAG: AAA family ATPase [Kofleriaceae bacterium]